MVSWCMHPSVMCFLPLMCLRLSQFVMCSCSSFIFFHVPYLFTRFFHNLSAQCSSVFCYYSWHYKHFHTYLFEHIYHRFSRFQLYLILSYFKLDATIYISTRLHTLATQVIANNRYNFCYLKCGLQVWISLFLSIFIIFMRFQFLFQSVAGFCFIYGSY